MEYAIGGDRVTGERGFRGLPPRYDAVPPCRRVGTARFTVDETLTWPSGADFAPEFLHERVARGSAA